MAEALLRKRLLELGKKEIGVHSAGVRALNGMSASDETISVMKEENVDVSDFRTREIMPDMIKKADLILVMEPEHRDQILKIMPEARYKTYLLKGYGRSSTEDMVDLSIIDPIGMSIEEYRIIRDEIRGQVDRIAKEL
jgi:protein-tyrosine phosphatase